MSNLRPAFVPYPSVHFRNELRYRGWKLEEFSQRSGISMARLCLPFHIDREFAEGCARAFGTSAELWLNLQSQWERWNRERQLYQKETGRFVRTFVELDDD